MALTDESNGNGFYMPVAPAYMGGGNGFGNGFGGDWGWIILLLLAFNGGWGGMGGFGGFAGGLGYDFPWLLNGQNGINNNVSDGFRSAQLSDGITSIRDGMTGNMGGTSYARDGRRNGRGGTYRGRYEGSYARGRGRNAKRDSMGRYSSEGYSRADGMDEMVDSIRSMMGELPPDVQRDAQRFVDKLEQQMM